MYFIYCLELVIIYKRDFKQLRLNCVKADYALSIEINNNLETIYTRL